MDETWVTFEVTKPEEKMGHSELAYVEQWAKDSSENGGVWFVFSMEIDDVYCIAYNGELYYK